MRKKSSSFIPVLEDYFTTYLTYSRGLSVNTINSYKQCFLLLLTFMREKKGKDPDEVSFADLGYDTLQEFLRWLETERDCTAATRNQRLSAISSFSEYAQNRDFDAASLFRTAVNRVPSKKTTKKPRAVITGLSSWMRVPSGLSRRKSATSESETCSLRELPVLQRSQVKARKRGA